MRLADAVALLRLHREEWDDGSLRDLEVFGSVARGEAGAASDVDFVLHFRGPVGLLRLVRFKLLFEELLERRVDVVTPAALKLALRDGVLADAVSVMHDEPATRPAGRPKRWRWRVEEMLGALLRIERYTAGLDEAAFRANDLVRDATLHNLLQLGESVNYLPDEVRALHPEVPWALLRQVRHLIAHDYFGLDWSLVWFTVREELPPLVPLLQGVMRKPPPRAGGAAAGSESA